MFQYVFSKNGVVAPYRNADRQKAVNKVAYKYGTGTGTAYKVRELFIYKYQNDWFFILTMAHPHIFLFSFTDNMKLIFKYISPQSDYLCCTIVIPEDGVAGAGKVYLKDYGQYDRNGYGYCNAIIMLL